MSSPLPVPTEKARLVFEFPLPPNLNRPGWGGHWGTKSRAQRQYWELLDALVMAKQLPKPPSPLQPWANVVGTAEMRTCPVMDQDNANRRMKWVWDWLQSRAYLVNDRDVRCDVIPMASTRKGAKIVLTLTEVAA